MRSDVTFQEEWDLLRGIPGMFYADSAREDHTRAREPWAAIHSRARKAVQLGFAQEDSRVAAHQPGQRPIPDSGHVFDEFKVQVVSGLKERAIDEVIVAVSGIDIDALYRSVANDPGTSGRVAAAVARLGTESFGTYLPWHVYAESAVTPWGMYFFLEPLVEWAAMLRHKGREHGLRLTVSQALRLAFFVTYRHELFHFHVEWFSVRQEVLYFNPVYRPYDEHVFRRVAGTDKWLEEALAQAVVLESTLVANRLGMPRRAFRALLESQFDEFGPGYRNFRCPELGGPGMGHRLLAAQIVNASVDHPIGSTESYTPKHEYNLAPKVVPGYLVWNPSVASQFQITRPKRKRFTSYLKQQGFVFAKYGPGDHESWRRGAQTVQINYDKGEGDLASIKAVAHTIGKPVGTVLSELRRRG